MKQFRFFLLGLFLVVFFQNCGFDPFGGKDEIPSLKGLQNNGEPYVGAPAAGTYYARKPDYSCDPTQAGAKISNVESVLRIDDGSQVAELVDNCTGEKQDIAIDELEASLLTRQYVSFDKKIFERFDEEPTPTAPIPQLICHYPSVSGFIAVEHILLAVPGENGQNTLVAVTHFALTPGQPQSTEPKPVQGVFDDEYPQGTPGVHIVAPQLDILFSRPSPDGVHHSSFFSGTVNDQPSSGTGLCIDPHALAQSN